MGIIGNIIEALEKGERIAVATILRTSGSTPASAFSRMLIVEGSATAVGTVGGGCMESDVTIAARRILQTQKGEILQFHLTEDEYVQGLICGGTVEVLVEPLSASHADLYRRLRAYTEDGVDCIVVTQLSPEGLPVSKRLFTMDEVLLERKSREVDIEIREGLQKVTKQRETFRCTSASGEWILEPVAGAPRLIIFGAGHVSRAICRLAAPAGFRVTVVDDRAEFANAERFPQAINIVVKEFAEAAEIVSIRPADYIVIVTRGHRYDEEILERLVSVPSYYLGMIGSRRKVLTTFRRLLGRGISEASLRRVCAPIGLEIGAATPEEIAVSILAELIARRRKNEGHHDSKSSVLDHLLASRSKESEPHNLAF